ncbi:calmin isoform X1 [Python bivittatus]|uniref:Calmin n=2 Tax=Python bivittatus TaxID=176946 RepID=A0A9F2NPL9_PYTBI|nr:calmin isoform X1 [Python bivittatus]
MAGSEWDWFQREELIGQISDIRVQNLQVERENVQKRTFTRWINLHLEKCSPPLEVKDLLVDIKDGKILMALLEVLSGQNLLHEYKPSTHRIFRLNNIAKALKFLEDSNVKLVSIDASEIADGNSSMVLGLIWNIILFFQIKELTGNLNRNSSSSSLSSGPSGPDSDTSHPSTPNVERNMSVSVKDQRKAIKALLTWVQRKTRKYGVAIQDFTSSWRSGLAFLAVIKAIDSSLVDMKQALEKSPRENLEDAFCTAQDHLGIPRLLEPEDIMVDSPDEQSIMTYVAQFLEHFPELEGEDFSDLDKEFPIESAYVHIKEIPGEEKQEKVLLLNENGEHISHIVGSQSPSPPIDALALPLHEENQNFHTTSEEPNDSLDDHMDSSTEQPQRPSSLPVTGFQMSPIANNLANNVTQSEGNQLNVSDSVKSDDLPSTVLTYRNDSVEPVDSDEFHSDMQKPSSETKESSESKICSLPWTPHSSKNVPEDLTNEPEYEIPGFVEQETAQKYILQMLNQEISKLPENDESAEQASNIKEIPATNQEIDEHDFKDNSEGSCTSEYFSQPISNTSRNLNIASEEEPMMTPNSSKISIIPHDLFYFPHYDVPISAVLDAFATSTSDTDLSLLENNKICSEILVNCLTENESLSLSTEGDIPKLDLQSSMKDVPKKMDDKSPRKQKRNSHSHTKCSFNKAAVVGKNTSPQKSSNMATTQNDSAHPDVPVIMANQSDTAAEERKLPEERSKRKEKRKNKAIFQGESTQSSKPGFTRLLDKLEEESIDHQGLSRISHSDPNVVFQINTTDSASKESGSTDVQKSTIISEYTSPAIRKRKDLEEEDVPEKEALYNSSSRTDQPELFYFIIFLWVLVYCLLLLPQLVSSPL